MTVLAQNQNPANLVWI